MCISYREIINYYNETKDVASLINSKDNRRNIIGNVINKINNILGKEEKIILLIPITNEKNEAYFSDGSYGWYAASNKEAIDYSRIFKDTIGNRLLIFTNKRLIFINLIRFIDNYDYHNYLYGDIKDIKIKPIYRENHEFMTLYFSKKDNTYFIEELYMDEGKKVESILNDFIKI